MRNFNRLFYFFICALVLIISSCENEVPVKKPVKEKVVVKIPQDVNKSASEELEFILSEYPNDTTLVIGLDTLLCYGFFKQLYNQEIKTLFSDKGKRTVLGDSLYALIKEARYYGLIPNDYHISEIDALYHLAYDKKEDKYNTFSLAKLDLLMCDAYFKMGAHANKGRFATDTILLEWNPAKLDTNWITTLLKGIKNNKMRAAINSLEPKHEAYQLLKVELKKFILKNENINWDSISCINVTDTVEFLAALKNRLIITGDYDTLHGRNKPDDVRMKRAIKSFQKKMKLKPDGKLGDLTKQALGLSKETTIRQIEMAMERWRWEPKKFPAKYFWVNIPSADLRVYEKGKKDKKTKQEKDSVVLWSNVVVGKPETPTPILDGKINYILIYPYWVVPYNIAWKEILPVVQRDTSYLRRNNFEVINKLGEPIDYSAINWKKYDKDYLPVKFRQRIGNENSLGVVKFNFYNKYGVYLHDTNSKRYFKTGYRYQSHGCIRLDKYWEVAKYLLKEDTLILPYDTLALYFSTPIQRKIELKKSVPIYIRYYTNTVDSLGLHYYADIYRKDEKMAKLLYKEK